MIKPRLSLFAAMAAFVSACSDRPAESTLPEPPPPALAGAWSGQFPCANCARIDVTLWLQPDGPYFLRQHYVDADGTVAIRAQSLGRWEWLAASNELVLQGEGPARRFSQPDPGTLAMLTASELPHRLSRDTTRPVFSDSTLLKGIAALRGSTATFSECLTGYRLALQTGGDYSRFVHQYRSTAGRDGEVFIEFDGHFVWADGSAPSSVQIDRFVTVRANSTCPD